MKSSLRVSPELPVVRIDLSNPNQLINQSVRLMLPHEMGHRRGLWSEGFVERIESSSEGYAVRLRFFAANQTQQFLMTLTNQGLNQHTWSVSGLKYQGVEVNALDAFRLELDQRIVRQIKNRLRQLIPFSRRSSQVISEALQEITMPDWLQLSTLQEQYSARYIQRTVELLEHVQNYGEQEHVVSVRRQIQWQKNHEMFVGLALANVTHFPFKRFSAGMDTLLEALVTLLDNYPARVENSLLLEMTRHHLMLLVNGTRGGSKHFSPETIADWQQQVEQISSCVQQIDGIPTNILEYEVDLLKKGIGALPSNQVGEGLELAARGAGGIFSFMSTGNPMGLINALRDGVAFGVKVAINQQSSNVFQLVYQVESFKRWMILKKIALSVLGDSDALTPNQQNKNGGELAQSEWSTWETTLQEIKQHAASFEKAVLRVNRHWEVGYAWMKALGDTLLYNQAIVSKNFIEKNVPVSGVRFDQLVAAGWIGLVSPDRGVIHYSLPGRLNGISAANNRKLKQWLAEKRLNRQTRYIDEYLYFGDGDEFHGLKHYITFGETQGVLGQLQSVGSQLLEGIAEGESVDKIFADQMPVLDQLATHIRLIFDQSVSLLQGEILKYCQKFIESIDEKIVNQIQQQLKVALDKSKLNLKSMGQDAVSQEYARIIDWLGDTTKKVAQARTEIQQIERTVNGLFDQGMGYYVLLAQGFDQQDVCITQIRGQLGILIALDLNDLKVLAEQSAHRVLQQYLCAYLTEFSEGRMVMLGDIQDEGSQPLVRALLDQLTADVLFQINNLWRRERSGLLKQVQTVLATAQEVETELIATIEALMTSLKIAVNEILSLERTIKFLSKLAGVSVSDYEQNKASAEGPVKKDVVKGGETGDVQEEKNELVDGKSSFELGGVNGFDDLSDNPTSHLRSLLMQQLTGLLEQGLEALRHLLLAELESVEAEVLSIVQALPTTQRPADQAEQVVGALETQFMSFLAPWTPEKFQEFFCGVSEEQQSGIDRVVVEWSSRLANQYEQQCSRMVRAVEGLGLFSNAKVYLQSIYDQLTRYQDQSRAFKARADSCVANLQRQKNLLDRECEGVMATIDHQFEASQALAEQLKAREKGSYENLFSYIDHIFAAVDNFELKAVTVGHLTQTVNDLLTVMGQMQANFTENFLALQTDTEGLMLVSKEAGGFGDRLKNAVTLQSLTDTANGMKQFAVDKTQREMERIYELSHKGISMMSDVGKKAMSIVHEIMPADRNVRSMFLNALVNYFGSHAWRVRERVLMNLYLMAAQKEVMATSIAEDIESQLTQRKVHEKDSRVKNLMDHPEYAQEMLAILKGNWESQQDVVKEKIQEKLEQIEALQERARIEPNSQVRQLLLAHCEEEQSTLNAQLSNVSGIAEQMGIVIQFLGEMKKQLDRIENKLIEIKEDLNEIKVGVQYLMGRPIPELFKCRLQQLNDDASYKKLNIPIKGEPYEDGSGKSSDLKARVFQFLANTNKSTLLIAGQSGSGKSTFMKHLAKDLLTAWKNDSAENKIIPIWCSLPALEQPLTKLVQETLRDYYGFDDRRIQELKAEVTKKDARYRLVFILDSYDEIKQEFQYKNLYDTNDLEEWGPPLQLEGESKVFPKVIITSRSEHTDPRPDHISWFQPIISDADTSRYKADEYYQELRISDFSSQKNEYLNAHYEGEIKKLFMVNMTKTDDLEALWGDFKTRFFEIDGETGLYKGLTHQRQEQELVLNALAQTYPNHSSEIMALSRHKVMQKCWTPLKYDHAVKELKDLLTTPFMLEIIVRVLPNIAESSVDEQAYKKQFLEKFYEFEKRGKNKAENYWHKVKKYLLTALSEEQRQHYQVDHLFLLSKEDFDREQQSVLVSVREKLMADDSFIVRQGKEEQVVELKENIMKALLLSLAPKKIIRYALYEAFVEFLFAREIEKLRGRKYGGKAKSDLDMRSDFEQYSRQLALAMVEKGIVRVNYAVAGELFREVSEWDRFFRLDSQLKEDVQRGVPIKGSGGVYSFIHKSLQEFFVAQVTYEHISQFPCLSYLKFVKALVAHLRQPKVREELEIHARKEIKQLSQEKQRQILPEIEKGGEAFALPIPLLMEKNMRSLVTYLKGTVVAKEEDRTEHFVVSFMDEVVSATHKLQTFPVMVGMLKQEPAICNRFLKEKVIEDEHFRDALFAIVEFSKIDHALFNTSALAMSILNIAQIPFSAMDLSGIHVPGAILSNGIYDSTNFEGANLANSDMSCSYLCHARFSQANMQDVSFGEYPNLVEHAGAILSVCLDPTGTQLASGSWDTTIKLWDMYTGQCLRTLEGHSAPVSCVRFHPVNGQLASAGYDGAINLWDANSGQCLSQLEQVEQAFAVADICFDPAGTQLASGLSGAFGIIIWDMESGTPLKTLEGHTGDICSVCFDASGERLISGSSDFFIRLWDVASGACLRVFGEMKDGHNHYVMKVSFSPSGQRLASSSADGTIKLWNPENVYCLQTLEGHGGFYKGLCFDSTGDRLVSSGDKTIKLWDVVGGQCLQVLQGHSNDVASVCFDESGDFLVSGSSDNTVKIWDITDPSYQHVLQDGHTGDVRDFCFNPTGQLLASVGSDATVKLWDTMTGRCLRTLSGHDHKYPGVAVSMGVDSVCFDSTGRWLASGGEDKTVKLWDVEDGRCLKTFKGHLKSVKGVCFDGAGEQLASLSEDNTIKLWNIEDGQCIKSLEENALEIRYVASERLTSKSQNGETKVYTTRLWNTESGDCLQILEHKGDIYFNPIEDRLLLDHLDHAVELRDIHADPSGERRATKEDRAIKLWRASQGGEGDAWILERNLSALKMILNGNEAILPDRNMLSERNLKLLSQRGAGSNLHMAVLAGQTKECIRLLIEGEDVAQKGQYSRTLLHMAAEKGHIELCKLLLEEYQVNQEPPTKEDIAKVQAGRKVIIEKVSGDSEFPSFFLHCHYSTDGDTEDRVYRKEISNPPESLMALILITRLPNESSVIRLQGSDLEIVQELVGDLGGTLPQPMSIDEQDEHGFTPLSLAAKHNHGDVCRLLLDSGSEVNKANLEGVTPLCIAAGGGHDDVCALLLDRGAGIDNADAQGRTPLHHAATQNHKDICIMLLDKGASVNQESPLFGTPLSVAVNTGNAGLCRLFLERGVNVDQGGDMLSAVPLIQAAQAGHQEICALLLDAGASPDLVDGQGSTALMHAATEGHVQICQSLLDKGASVDAKNELMNDVSALCFAVVFGQLEVCRLLLQRGAQVDQIDKHGQAAFLKAVLAGNMPICELLLEYGADIDHLVAGSGMATPLHNAIRGQLEMLEFLLSKGANVDKPDDIGYTPLFYTVFHNREDAANLILEKGANVSYLDGACSGLSVFHMAILSDRIDFVKLFMDHVDVNMPTREGLSPLHVGIINGCSIEIIEFLLEKGADIHAPCLGISVGTLAELVGSQIHIRFLREKGCLFNQEELSNLLPVKLFFRSKYCNSIFNKLDELGVNLSRRANDGQTWFNAAISFASATRPRTIEPINVLMELDVSPCVADLSGATPLELAQQLDFADAVHMLTSYVEKHMMRAHDQNVLSLESGTSQAPSTDKIVKVGASAVSDAGIFSEQPDGNGVSCQNSGLEPVKKAI